MKIKLLLLMSLLFFVEISFAQNTVTYSSLNNTINLDSGVEGTVDVLVNCYGSSSTPVFLNATQSCGNNDGILSTSYTNGSILTPGQSTIIRYKFKKTVTTDTQIVYKFSTDGSCFQNESKMIKITVNYKTGTTTTPPTTTPPTEDITIYIDANNLANTSFNINEGSISPRLSGTTPYPIHASQWQIKKNGVWVDIPGATNIQEYYPGTVSVTSQYRRRLKKYDSYIYSNEVTLVVIPAPAIENNTITLNGDIIKGNLPTGGIGTYEYSWVLWGAEDPYTFPDTGQNLLITESLYNFLSSYPNATIVRYVTSGTRGSVSNHVNILPVPLPIPDIQNNTISINGYQITGSQPTGGIGEYAYSWFLGSQEDPIIFDETTKDLDLTPYPLAISLLQNDHTAVIFRTVRSVKRSNSNKISLYGTSVLNIQSQTDLLTVYPNPTSESINFSTTFSTEKDIEIIIYSESLPDTKSVFKGRVIPNQIVNWNIPSNYSKGIYFYKILSDNNEVKSGKFIYR